MSMPRVAETDAEIEACYAVMAELRPHIERARFLPLVREMQCEGYRLASLCDRSGVVCVAGYRIVTNLHMGRHLYVEDLVTAAGARSQGHGERMLDWLRGEAQRQQCAVLDLDSGTQRHAAHRFYFRHGFSIASYHFWQSLDAT